MKGESCPHCEHEITLGRCWRLTCPSNGFMGDPEGVRKGERYLGAKRESAERARQIMAGHPSSWGDEPQQEFML